MSTLEKAIEIAARAHAGQVDKAGAPDVLHPPRVMLSVKTSHEQMAAALHDVVEDKPVTLDDLKARKAFLQRCWRRSRSSPRSRVRPVSKPLRRAAQNPIARVVKAADVMDNLDLGRISHPFEQDYARLKEYSEVKALLEQPPRPSRGIEARRLKGTGFPWQPHSGWPPATLKAPRLDRSACAWRHCFPDRLRQP